MAAIQDKHPLFPVPERDTLDEGEYERDFA
jgi:hypothetical protein